MDCGEGGVGGDLGGEVGGGVAILWRGLRMGWWWWCVGAVRITVDGIAG